MKQIEIAKFYLNPSEKQWEGRNIIWPAACQQQQQQQLKENRITNEINFDSVTCLEENLV